MRPNGEELRRLLGIYLVTDPAIGRPRSVVEAVRQAVEAGVRCVQLRDKGASHDELVTHGRRLLEITRPAGALLILDDDVSAAVDADADGAHVGQEDMPPGTARSLLGPDRVLGVSVRTAEEARRAEADGADYLAANLVFPTATKTDAGEPLGLAGIERLREATALPLVAIGGIDASNAASVIAAGADGIAVVSAIMAAPDIPAACRLLQRSMVSG
ncbi:thiamine phosphate synthase [Candidatus Fermentibacteria bacterium]|nr:thiamine phosphate synthase [Candidatus Fermentibacteria bacterium]